MAIVSIAFGDNVNDLQQLLVRMTANTSTSAATALRHALLALSFQYLTLPPMAIQHQNEAMQSLQVTIEKSLPWHKEEAFQAIAASMLLSIYEVCQLLSSLLFTMFQVTVKIILL